MNDNKSSGGGLGFCGILAVVFIVLKLCKVISWSWVWVLCPLWGGLVLSVLIIVIVVMFLRRW